MELGLKGKTAIITGGASGIGFGCARALAEEKVNVVLADINEELAKQKAQFLMDELKVKAWGISLDVCDRDKINQFWQTVDETVGEVDILVNNAGGMVTHAPLNEIEDDAWLKTFDLTAHSGFFISKQFAKQFKKTRGTGAIINITSKTAIMSTSKNNAHYAAAKSAVIGMTRIMAKDLYDLGIRCNCVAPGYVKTERTYLDSNPVTAEKRKVLLTHDFATPSDIGNVVTFLASDKSYQVIGAVVDVTGGTLC